MVILEKAVAFVVTMIGGWIGADFVSPHTRLGYLLVFLGVALVLAIIYGVVGWGRKQGSAHQSPESEASHHEVAPTNKAALVSDIWLGTKQANDANPWLIRVGAETTATGARLRVFLDYSLDFDGKWGKPVRFPLAEIKDYYRGQRIDVWVLRRRQYLQNGARAWDLRWGDENAPDNHSAYMRDFKYKTRLVFEDASGAEQEYPFCIVKPDAGRDVSAEPQIVRPEDWQWSNSKSPD